MYCYIQEIKLKKDTFNGKSKYIEPIEYNNNGRTIYSYMMSEERFIRDKNISYKVTLQDSYRENGRVKKKQWHICSMDYYSITDIGACFTDYITHKRLEKILKEAGLEEETLEEIIYKKLDPLYEKIINEYKQTEEYKINRRNEAILQAYNIKKNEFDKKYGYDTYRQCYDVFGNLKNEERLIELKEQYKRNQEYQRSYHEYSRSSYSNYNKRSYHENNRSSYNENDKKILKKMYKKLAMEFHPDRNNNSEESQRAMQIINNLKEEWKV